MNNRQHQQNNKQPKVKPVSKGWNRTLKTWLAQSTGPEAGVYRGALRQEKIGCFLEHNGLAQLAQQLRGSTAWWAGRR